MIWWTLALAGTGSIDLLVGSRSAPEAGLEQDDSYEYGEGTELEPSLLTALVGRYGHRDGLSWIQLDSSAWLYLPEGETSALALAPSVGSSSPVGDWRLDAAGAYDLVVYPVEGDASGGRAELYAAAQRPGTWSSGVSVVGIDRHYFARPDWSFRSAAPSFELGWDDDVVWARAVATGQVNQHQGEVGTQVRGRGEVGVRPRNFDVWTTYTLIAAQGGAPSGAVRPVITLVGGYSDDADAVSGGGFLQHRGEVGLGWASESWAVRAYAMGRYRVPLADDRGAFDRTGHGQVDVERRLTGPWHLLLTTGVNGARTVGGSSFLDVYGWAGLSWRPGSER